MTTLTWRNSDASDRDALQRFQCTERTKRRGRTVYPRPWERQVERAVREVNPRGGSPDSAVRVGCNDDGAITAVVSVGMNADYGAYMIEAVAVSVPYRRLGGAIADEALEDGVQWALARLDAAGDRAPIVFADLDPRNDAARQLLVRQRFRMLTHRPEYEVWTFEPGTLPFDLP